MDTCHNTMCKCKLCYLGLCHPHPQCLCMKCKLKNHTKCQKGHSSFTRIAMMNSSIDQICHLAAVGTSITSNQKASGRSKNKKTNVRKCTPTIKPWCMLNILAVNYVCLTAVQVLHVCFAKRAFVRCPCITSKLPKSLGKNLGQPPPVLLVNMITGTQTPKTRSNLN